MTLFDRGAFVDKFAQEAREYLELLNRGLVELEKSPDDADMLTDLLRAAHTLKGSSRMLKLMDINQVAHCMEDLLEEIKTGQVEMSAEVGDVFFLALDQIGVCIEAVASGGEGDQDVSAVCHSLGNLGSAAEPEVEVVPPEESATELNREAFVDKFAQEAREYLELLNRGLVELEKSPDDADMLTDLLRAAHTLKGSSRMLKLMDINQVAHCMEDLLEEIKTGQVEMSAEVGDVFFLALDQIGVCIEAVASGGEGDQDVSAVCYSLESLKSAAGPETTATDPEARTATEERVPAEIPRLKSGKKGSTLPQVEGEQTDKPAKKRPATAVEETIRIDTSGLDTTIRLAGEIRVSSMRLDHNFDELADIRRTFRHYQGNVERCLGGENGRARELEQICQETKNLYVRMDNLKA